MGYSIFLSPLAIQDIQEAVDYYEEQQIGLGEKFENAVDDHVQILERNPFYQIRYDNIRCLPIKKFPFMMHFTIDEGRNAVVIRAIFHTSRDSKV